MDTFLFVVIFIIILIIYLHIMDELKKSSDLEIYEIDYKNNDKLQEIASLKQPFVFTLNNVYLENENETTIELKVKDVEKKYDEYVLLSLSAVTKLIDTDKKSRYYTENNNEYAYDKYSEFFNKLNYYLKPNFTVNSEYDYLFGSQGTYTPFRYHMYSRYFIYAESGTVQIRMVPWKYEKEMKVIIDNTQMEYYSNIDLWEGEHENIKYIDFYLNQGSYLYIPAFWFYSIKYKEYCEIFALKYQTPANLLISVPKYFLAYLQNDNTTLNVFKKFKLNN